ncbi:hypothetical protein BJF96_g2979 [Verticillium dahliae]|uniref:Uncharacterized protein n=1 Tax=Verticillium dahliae TaxID=27337 RepID=A0AA44WM02_VERDA|nr:hypothetical protein BJF96_g2979 [Verticillium dahliae]
MSGEPKFVGFEGIPYADNCLLRQAHVSVKPRSVANGARVGRLVYAFLLGWLWRFGNGAVDCAGVPLAEW